MKALQYFGDRRTKNGKGVTIPSQRRYVYFFDAYMKLFVQPKISFPFQGIPMTLRYLTLSHAPNFDKIGGCDPYAIISNHKEKCLFKQSNKNIRHFISPETDRVLNFNAVVEGDFKVAVVDADFGSKDDYMFSFWLNTAFMIGNSSVLLTRHALDGIKQNKNKFASDFSIRLEYTYDPEHPIVKELEAQGITKILDNVGSSYENKVHESKGKDELSRSRASVKDSAYVRTEDEENEEQKTNCSLFGMKKEKAKKYKRKLEDTLSVITIDKHGVEEDLSSKYVLIRERNLCYYMSYSHSTQIGQEIGLMPLRLISALEFDVQNLQVTVIGYPKSLKIGMLARESYDSWTERLKSILKKNNLESENSVLEDVVKYKSKSSFSLRTWQNRFLRVDFEKNELSIWKYKPDTKAGVETTKPIASFILKTLKSVSLYDKGSSRFEIVSENGSKHSFNAGTHANALLWVGTLDLLMRK